MMTDNLSDTVDVYEYVQAVSMDAHSTDDYGFVYTCMYVSRQDALATNNSTPD